MNNGLLLILSIIGILALYWVLIGQWKYNKMLIEADNTNLSEESDLSKDNKIIKEDENNIIMEKNKKEITKKE